jgi:DNA replication protein DnaC
MSARGQGRVDLDATRAQLEQVGLVHAAERLAELVEESVKGNEPAHRFLDRLLAAESGEREMRRIRTSLRLSGLPPGLTLGGFDFAFQPSVEKSRVETLATCSWIREHATVLMQGPPGVGKTHLAVALGVKAVENGSRSPSSASTTCWRLSSATPTCRRSGCAGRSTTASPC